MNLLISLLLLTYDPEWHKLALSFLSLTGANI